MFTINGEGTEYLHVAMAIAAARALMFVIPRSVIIYQNGKPFRLLRY